MMQTGLLKSDTDGLIHFPIESQVIRKGQILILPRLFDPQAKSFVARGDGPHADAKGQEDVFEGQSGGAMG